MHWYDVLTYGLAVVVEMGDEHSVDLAQSLRHNVWQLGREHLLGTAGVDRHAQLGVCHIAKRFHGYVLPELGERNLLFVVDKKDPEH